MRTTIYSTVSQKCFPFIFVSIIINRCPFRFLSHNHFLSGYNPFDQKKNLFVHSFFISAFNNTLLPVMNKISFVVLSEIDRFMIFFYEYKILSFLYHMPFILKIYKYILISILIWTMCHFYGLNKLAINRGILRIFMKGIFFLFIWK